MKESFYFPHDNDARNDDRILELRSCYGNDWYALFFYTLETMSQSEDWGINRVAIGGLSLGYGVDKGMLESFYQKCIDLWLFFEENWKIFSQRMLQHKNARRELSEAWKRGAAKRWKNSHPISPPNSNPIARKGKERKGNIVNSSIEVLEEKPKQKTPKEIAEEFFATEPEQIVSSLSVDPEHREKVLGEIRKFISCWTEPNKTWTKVRWQMEKTFEVERRLRTWFDRAGQSSVKFTSYKKSHANFD